jgi:Flp pilus assembly protein TadG
LEFAFVLPLLLLLGLGVIEMSYLLHDQHIVIRLTREGSNLISRNVTISDAATAMRSIANPPVDFNGSNSKLIFTVLTRYSGGLNYDYVIVYQRYEIGSLAASSAFTTQGPLSGAFGPAPDYIAVNPSNNTNLRVTNVPANLLLNRGQFVYVTEIYTHHGLITPFENIGISLPSTLYSIAYF